MQIHTLPIEPKQIQWDSKERNYACETVKIFDGSFHLEFIRVDKDGSAVDFSHDNKLETVASVMSDDKFSTVKIGHKSYVLIMTPFDR